MCFILLFPWPPVEYTYILEIFISEADSWARAVQADAVSWTSACTTHNTRACADARFHHCGDSDGDPCENPQDTMSRGSQTQTANTAQTP